MSTTTIQNDMQKMTTSWNKITTYEGESDRSEVVAYVIQCLRGLKGDEFLEILPSVDHREWKVLASTTKSEQQLVATLSTSYSDIWSEPARVDFDTRIYVYWNDWGLGRLEVSCKEVSVAGRIFEAFGTLAMKSKLAAA